MGNEKFIWDALFHRSISPPAPDCAYAYEPPVGLAHEIRTDHFD